MNEVILKLIRIVTALTGTESSRDLHYQIVLDYNNGKPLWFVEHDGKAWQMEQYVPPSRNGFKTFRQAEAAMIETLLAVSAQEIDYQKSLNDNEPGKLPVDKVTELEVEYLVLEIAS